MKISENGDEIIEQLIREEIKGVYNLIYNIDTGIYIIWYGLFVFCYVILDIAVVNKVKKFLFEIQRILVMIPLKTIKENKEMMKLLLSGNEKMFRKRRRKRK